MNTGTVHWTALRVRVLLAVAVAVASHVVNAAGPVIDGCMIFPDDHILNTPVDTLPVHSNSAAWVNTIGPSGPLHPDFGPTHAIPYLVVTSNEPAVAVTFEYVDESEPGPYPIPTNAPVEGGSGSTGDRHVLALDKDHGLLYELFSAYPGTNHWDAVSGAIFDLDGYSLRPQTWTSADAAGLPILPLLVRYDEIAAGEIRHAIRFTAPQTRKQYLWPARHYASTNTSFVFPPMGARFRLKADYDISRFDPTNRVILQALKTYGMILADNGGAWYMTGAPDPRFDNDLLHSLTTVTGGVFEAVDCSYLMFTNDSAKARSPWPVFRSAEIRDDSFAFTAELLPNLPHTVERTASLQTTGQWASVEQFTPTNTGTTSRSYAFDSTNTWFYRVRR